MLAVVLGGVHDGDLLWFFDCALFLQRMGDELNDLDLDELRSLEQKMDDSLTIIRKRKTLPSEVSIEAGEHRSQGTIYLRCNGGIKTELGRDSVDMLRSRDVEGSVERVIEKLARRWMVGWRLNWVIFTIMKVRRR
ncbi:hypothetical protein LguiA_026603 [Lonicera macranthoides]